MTRPVVLALLWVQVAFATLPIAIKFALRDLSSPTVALLRVSGAAVLFLLLHRLLVNGRIAHRADYARLALYALFGVVANQLLYITALTMTTATAAQTLMTVGPAMTLLVAIALGRERASAGKWLGILVAGAGALVMVGVELGSGRAPGNLLVLLNVAAFSVYLVISRDILRRYHPLTVITWVFVFGALGLVPWGLPGLVGELRSVTPTSAAALAWMVVVPTVGGYYTNQWALQRVEASVVAIWVYLQPVVTALLAIPLLGETVSPRLIPAALLIFSGVAISVRAGQAERRRERERPSPADQDHVEG